MDATETEFLIVGAGVAGLSCARELRRAGRSVALLEKSRGVGGRCATRRIRNQPVDHGPGFFHGSDRDFLRAIEELAPASRIEGWPSRVRGEGRPCLPRAFGRGERCVAFREGATAFPKHLARDLDVRLETEVQALDVAEGSVRADCGDGRMVRGATVILTPPVAQTLRLIDSIPDRPREIEAMRALLAMMANLPCLVVLAGYPPDIPLPEWQVRYPEESRMLQVISHDSDKRVDPALHVFVFQCLPGWSRMFMEEDPEQWMPRVLEEARSLLGPWAGDPVWAHAHRWRYARAGTGNELTRPIVGSLPGGARLALTGEVFSPGGGVQGAWIAGRDLGRRLSTEIAP